MAGPILGIDFFRKFKVTVVPEINQIQFALTAAAPPAPSLPSAASPASSLLSAASSTSSLLPTSTSVPAPVQKMPAAMTSSQPPAISAHVVRNPAVKSSSFSSRENRFLLDPPPSLQKIPDDSVPAEVKALLQKFPSILCTADVKLTPTHGVEHHIHTGSHPPVFAKSCRLNPEQLQSAKTEFKSLEAAGIICRSKSPWASPLHMVPKKDGTWWPYGDYRRLNLVTTPEKYPLPNM